MLVGEIRFAKGEIYLDLFTFVLVNLYRFLER